jgi:hypothetical protein
MSIVTITLALMLFLGFIFLVVHRESRKSEPSLKTKELALSEISALVMLVSDNRSHKQFEEMRDYKILQNLAEVHQNPPIPVWLISDADSSNADSSYNIALKLKHTFGEKFLWVRVEDVRDINDPNHVFAAINRIFTSAQNESGLQERDLVCDCTGGIKLMSIGMALACVGKRRLVYLTKDDKYLEIDLQNLLDSILRKLAKQR